MLFLNRLKSRINHANEKDFDDFYLSILEKSCTFAAKLTTHGARHMADGEPDREQGYLCKSGISRKTDATNDDKNVAKMQIIRKENRTLVHRYYLRIASDVIPM